METVLKKLGYKEGQSVAVVNLPEDLTVDIIEYLTAQGALSEEKLHRDLSQKVDFVLFGALSAKELEGQEKALAQSILPEGRLWILYPKKSSKKYKSDLSRDLLWDLLGSFDFEPVSQFAVNEDFSAIRFRPFTEIKKNDPKEVCF